MFLRGSRLRLEGVGVGRGCVGMGLGCSRVWGVGAPIETPFTNFNSPVSVRGGQAEEQGPQALEGNILLPTFFSDRCRLCSQGREKSEK